MHVIWTDEDTRIAFRMLLHAALDQRAPSKALQNATQELLLRTRHELALDNARPAR